MLLGIGLASTIKSIRQPDLGFNVSLTERTLEERKEKDVVYLCRRKPRLLVYVKFLCLLFSQLYFTQVCMCFQLMSELVSSYCLVRMYFQLMIEFSLAVLFSMYVFQLSSQFNLAMCPCCIC